MKKKPAGRLRTGLDDGPELPHYRRPRSLAESPHVPAPAGIIRRSVVTLVIDHETTEAPEELAAALYWSAKRAAARARRPRRIDSYRLESSITGEARAIYRQPIPAPAMFPDTLRTPARGNSKETKGKKA